MRVARKWVTGVLAGVLGFGALVGCGNDPVPSPTVSAPPSPPSSPTSNLSAADATFVDETVGRAMADGKLPGVTVSVFGPGKTFLRSYGVADTATGRALSPTDHFRVGSVTKTFVATAILRLVDDKKIALDDPLEKYLPGIPNGTIVTLRQLLNMRSGLPSYTTPEFEAAWSADPLLPSWKHEDVLGFLRSTPVNFTPGEKFEYSNSNYVLLGMILEKVTGQSAEQILTDLIGELGLKNTTVSTPATNSALPEPFTHGYNHDTGRDDTASNPDVGWTAGNVISTVPDLAQYARLLAEGATLSPESQRERLATLPLGPDVPAGYGLGIIRIGDSWLGHGGSLPGYGNFTYHLVSENATIVVMANGLTIGTPSENEPNLIFNALAKHFYPGSLPHVPTEPPIPQDSVD